jgi:hypothetical protein
MPSPGDRLDWDISATGTVTVNMDIPTSNGYDQVVLRPNQIDDQAQALYGYHSCHFLASAISCMTGDWPLVTVTGCPPGADQPRHIHTAVVAPDGRVLDIFGASASVQDWYASWADRVGFPLTLHDRLRSEDIPEVVTKPGASDLPRGRLWWVQDSGGNDTMSAVHLHFARAVLRQHGYDQHLPRQSRSAGDGPQAQRSVPACPPPSPTSPLSSTSGGSVMGIEEVRNAVQQAQQDGTQILGSVQQAISDTGHIRALLAQAFTGSEHHAPAESLGALDRAESLLEEARSLVHIGIEAAGSYGAAL